MANLSWLDDFFVTEDPGDTLTNATAGTQNNVTTTDAEGDDAGAIRFTAVTTLTGLTSGSSKRRLIILACGVAVTMKNQDTNSVTTNRIITGTGGDLVITADGAALLVYDATDSRWRVATASIGGGGGGANPGGSGTQAQYRVDGTTLGGMSGMDWDTTNSRVRFLTPPALQDTSGSQFYIFQVSNLAADRTVIWPLLTANDTIVFQGHAQAITNKTIDADSNTITNIENADIKAGAGIVSTKLVPPGSDTQLIVNVAGAFAAFSGLTRDATLNEPRIATGGALQFDNTGSTFRGRLTANVSATRTWALPNATGTIVLEDNAVALTNKTYYGVGASPASAGTGVRLPNNAGVYARANGGADVTLINIDTADIISIGSATNVSQVDIRASSTVFLRADSTTIRLANGTNLAIWDNLGLRIYGGRVRYTATRTDVHSLHGEVQTSSTTPTTITGASFTMANETMVTIDFVASFARRTNVTKAGRYKGTVTYRRTGGGAPTIVGTAEYATPHETTAGDNVAFAVSSNTISAEATAADSDGRNWECEFVVRETTAV